MHDDSTTPPSQQDMEIGYARMFPLIECKLEVQDTFDEDVDISPASWYDGTQSAVSIKEEPAFVLDNSSQESVEEDFETESTQYGTSNAAPCVVCGFTASSVRGMWEHRFACQAKKVHICNVCQERFDSKNDLGNHILCHQIHQLHSCQTCGSSFHRKADLQNHMVSHQVERPHKCSICGADFQRHSSLANHIKIHSYSPGRALLSSFCNSESNSNQSQVMPLVSQTSNWSDPSWVSKDPIPSFETLPSPLISYQHSMGNPSSLNFSCLRSKTVISSESNELLNGINSAVEPPSSEHFLNQRQGKNEGKISQFESETHSAEACLSQTLESNAPPPDSSICQVSALSIKNHLLGRTDLKEEVDCRKNNGDPAYSAVKQVGLLYGIKIEESLFSAEQGTDLMQQPDSGVQTQTSICQQNSIGVKSDVSTALPIQVFNPFSCPKCQLSCSCKEDLQTHVCLPNDPWNTTFSSKVPSTSQSYEVSVHMKSSESEAKAHLAESSHLNFIAEESSSQDAATHNKSTLKHFCVDCHKKFATKQKLFRHMWIHRKKQFTCETCGVVFSERLTLDGHRLSQHPPSFSSPFACTECGKTFASRQSLWEHGRVHGNVSSGGASLLQCQECNKSFASRQGYQIHIRTHTGERPYGCRFCLKSFRDGGTLRKHERIHTGERPHACPLCSRAFNQKVVLREHVRWVHAATTTCEPPFSCQICNMLLNDREELCVHIVKHSDDLAAIARAAAKKESSLDSRNPSRLPPQNVMPPMTTAKETEVHTSSYSVCEINESRICGNGVDSWTHLDEKTIGSSLKNCSFQAPSNCLENFEGNQSMSDVDPGSCYVYLSQGNASDCHYIGSVSSTGSIGQTTNFDVITESKQMYSNDFATSGSSGNFLQFSKSFSRYPKYFDGLEFKPAITFSDPLSSSFSEMSHQKLPCQSSVTEQVVINV